MQEETPKSKPKKANFIKQCLLPLHNYVALHDHTQYYEAISPLPHGGDIQIKEEKSRYILFVRSLQIERNITSFGQLDERKNQPIT